MEKEGTWKKLNDFARRHKKKLVITLGVILLFDIFLMTLPDDKKSGQDVQKSNQIVSENKIEILKRVLNTTDLKDKLGYESFSVNYSPKTGLIATLFFDKNKNPDVSIGRACINTLIQALGKLYNNNINCVIVKYKQKDGQQLKEIIGGSLKSKGNIRNFTWGDKYALDAPLNLRSKEVRFDDTLNKNEIENIEQKISSIELIKLAQGLSLLPQIDKELDNQKETRSTKYNGNSLFFTRKVVDFSPDKGFFIRLMYFLPNNQKLLEFVQYSMQSISEKNARDGYELFSSTSKIQAKNCIESIKNIISSFGYNQLKNGKVNVDIPISCQILVIFENEPVDTDRIYLTEDGEKWDSNKDFYKRLKEIIYNNN